MAYQPQLIEVDPQRIKFNPQNPRKHQGTEFDRLRQSVKEVGVVQLPTVRVLPGGFYEVIDGEGRVRAAQEKHQATIWVVSFGHVGDEDALTMLQSANSVREFSLLAECRGMANMHRQGQSTERIAQKLGMASSSVRDYVGVGYFPDRLMDLIRGGVNGGATSGVQWGIRTLGDLLVLRQILPGQENPRMHGMHSVIDGVYDYAEVFRAVEKIVGGELTSSAEIHAYIEQRRRELFEKRFDQELRARLEAELTSSKQALEESYQQQLQGVQEEIARRYEAQVASLDKQYRELEQEYKSVVAKSARQPDLIKEYEQRMEKKQKEVEAERARWQRLQEEVKLEVQKTQQEAQRTIQQQLSEAIKEQRRAMDQQLEQARVDMEAYYAQKDQQRQLKAENSVRQAVAHGTELLTQTQQSFLHLTTPDFVKGIAWLPETEVGSLLAQIMAVQDTLTKALEAIRHGYSVESEERVITTHG